MPELSHRTRVVIRLVLFALILGIVFWLTNYVAEHESVQYLVSRFGYLGIFIASVISGFNLIVPIPIATFIPLFIESGFPFRSTIITISLGMTTGDILSYWLGRAGRYVVHEERAHRSWMFARLERLRERYPYAPYAILFLVVSFAPIPNELTVLPMGFLGYRFSLMFPIIFCGNLIFNYLSGAGLLAFFHISG